MDLFFAFFLVGAISLPLGLPDWAEGVMVLGVFAYPFLANREMVWSLGRWALGLRRYRFSEIAEYGGKGSLWVVQPLPAREYTWRTLIAVTLLGVVYLLFLGLSPAGMG